MHTRLLNGAFVLGRSLGRRLCDSSAAIYAVCLEQGAVAGLQCSLHWEGAACRAMRSPGSSSSRAELAASAGAVVAEGTARAERGGVGPAGRNDVLWRVRLGPLRETCERRRSGRVGPVRPGHGAVETEIFPNAGAFLPGI